LLAPLDLVQPDRFLADYAQDPSLTPEPDQSVVGLLNDPTVIHSMAFPGGLSSIDGLPTGPRARIAPCGRTKAILGAQVR